MKTYFTFTPHQAQQEALMKRYPKMHFVFHRALDEQELMDTDILVTYGEDVTAEHLNLAQQLKWIMVASAGVEQLPAEELVARGVIVTNAKGIHKIPMTESVLAHILANKRSLPWIYDQQNKAEWSRKSRSTELYGSTAIILGPGAIGSHIGQALKGFGVYTIGCNRSGKPVSSMDRVIPFSDLLKELPTADLVISLLPSTKETKHLLTDEHFKVMKDTALFCNFGRGDVVAENVLLRMLQKNEIAHAILDVFETEPLPSEHPFWTMDNVTVSPHVSSHSSKYIERALEIFERNLVKWQEGEMDLENLVDLTRGY